MLKRSLVLAGLMLGLSSLGLSGMAFADTIDFLASGHGGSWSFSGSGPVTITALRLEVEDETTLQFAPINGLSTEALTSGAFLGGLGTASNPWTFGPSAAGSFTIVGCVPPGPVGCTNVTLFSGQMGDSSLFNGAGGVLYDSANITGTIDPALLAYFGSSGSSFQGVLDFTLSGHAPGSGATGSGDLLLSPAVPEPASMLLLGSGMLGLAGLFRRKFKSN
ncbi:MAG TPA: PEP-CTERM sorting domain-containing protein [Terriglobia bacterium]|nr:PEP-CTERM sorting domain-containing protein [Terriglobia bacterium]